MAMPKWSTLDRRAHLVKLFLDSGGFCVYGHKDCLIPAHHYEVYIEGLDIDVEVTEYYREPVPCKSSETGWVIAKIPIKVLRKVHIEGLIDYWKADDREQARLDWLEERKALHDLGEPRYREGRFGSISRDIFHDKQPLYYLEALGISGLTLTPFAKIKLGSSYMRLYVDLGDSLRGISKNKRRKAIRYGKELPKVIDERIAVKIREAVRHYLK